MKQFTLGLVLIMSMTAASAGTYNGYETPDYTLVERFADIEIRTYAPVTEARVSREGGRSSAAGSGFRSLAGYIFGGNQTGEKIAMTAPVIQERTDEKWEISFILPSALSPETAPSPNANEVDIRTRPAVKMAVIQFSGMWTEARLSQYEAKLRDTLAANGLNAQGAPVYMFYNDPMTLPWKRRNEIGIRISE